MTMDMRSNDNAGVDAGQADMAEGAWAGDFTAAAVSVLVNQSNLLALEAMLGVAHRGVDQPPYHALIAEARELAMAASRTTMRLIESQVPQAIQREALKMGNLAMERFHSLDRSES